MGNQDQKTGQGVNMTNMNNNFSGNRSNHDGSHNSNHGGAAAPNPGGHFDLRKAILEVMKQMTKTQKFVNK